MTRTLTHLFAFFVIAAVLTGTTQPAVADDDQAPGLRDAVVLIIRHAEKPENGPGLSETGQQRATAYINYFKTLSVEARTLTPDYLFATADSEASHRPRLTLEPLSQALGLKIDNRFKNKNFADLARDIKSADHGKCILIAWHHGEIPELVNALGGDATVLVPEGKWPAQTFNWVLVLRYDHQGRLIPNAAQRINENLLPGDAKQ